MKKDQNKQSEYIKSLLDVGSKTIHNQAELVLPDWVEPGRIKR